MADSHRRISVHQALGAGLVADLLLWKKWCGGFATLASATALWYLFERAGYNLLSFASNVLLLLVFILFFWAKAASLLNRPLPPLPDLEISEASATKVAEELQTWINYALSIGYEIAIRRNFILFVEIAAALWFLSYIGSMYNLLTLIYIGVLLSLSVPLLYEKYQDKIDDKLFLVYEIIQIQKKIFHTTAIPSYKQKKMH